METITVKISNTGEIEYTVAGVKGKRCRDVTKAIDALSAKVISSETTGEFCEIPATDTNKIRGQS